MGKIEEVVKSEIIRLTKKQLRIVVGPLVRDLRRMRRKVSQLAASAAKMQRVAAEWAEKMGAEKAQLRAPEDEVKAARFSAGLIRKLRARLGLSQGDLALLCAVSGVAVWSWESGRTRPTAVNRSALVALRKMGRREVKKLLAQKQAEAPKPEPKPAKRRRRAKKQAGK